MSEKNPQVLEEELSSYLKKRRILLGIATAFFLTLGIVFVCAREATREVTVHGVGFLSFESVTYNNTYLVGVLIGLLAATITGSCLLVDLLYCRFETITANGFAVTVYRGMNQCAVYIDGAETERIGPFSFTNTIDTRLPDGTKICISFCRGIFVMAHIAFSDSNPSIDL